MCCEQAFTLSNVGLVGGRYGGAACVAVENVSVLRWWFEDKSAQLIVNESLRVQLSLATDQRFWEIQLSGAICLSH